MRKWFIAVLLMLIYASSMVDRQILSLVIDLIRADLKLSDTQIGLLAGPAFVILHVVCLLPFGMLVDSWNRRNLVALGASFWALMTASCGMAGSFWTLGAARAGVGVGEATLSPAAYSILADYFPKSQLSRALSIYALGLPLGGTLALVGGGWLIGELKAIGPVALPLIGLLQPWQLVFLIVALPGLPLALVMALFVREPERRRDDAAADQPALIAVLSYMGSNSAIYVAILLGGGFLAIFSYGVSYWLPTTLERVHGLSIREAGLLIGLTTFFLGIPGTLFSGWLADRLVALGRPDGPLLVGIFYAIGLLVCLACGPLVRPVWLSLAMTGAGMFFLNSWAIGVAPALLQSVTPGRMRGRVSAIYVLVSAVMGLGLGPPAVAIATDYVFRSDNAISVSLAFVGIVSLFAAMICMQYGRSAMRNTRSGREMAIGA